MIKAITPVKTAAVKAYDYISEASILPKLERPSVKPYEYFSPRNVHELSTATKAEKTIADVAKSNEHIDFFA